VNDNCDNEISTDGVAQFDKFQDLLQKSASFILYLTSTDCDDTDEENVVAGPGPL